MDSTPITSSRDNRILIAISALLISTLACNYATRLIFPPTPTPLPTATLIPSATATPFLPPATVTPTVFVYTPSCPNSLKKIIRDSTKSPQKISSSESDTETDIIELVHYTITDDGNLRPVNYEDVPKKFKSAQDDRAAHEEIWEYFKRLIPPDQIDFVSGFTVFTDGEFNYLASVNQSDRNLYKWELNVDYADTTPKTELTFTLLHEFGHLLTLNENQVEASVPIYHHPFDDEIYQQEADACPQYFPGEGCSQPDSYINQFFERFWLDFYDEWQSIDQEEDEDKYNDMLDDFYKTYQDQFLTDYAPTSPSEDLAESWTFFVLAPKPELNSIAHEKILFFYEYPELVNLRSQILDKICTEFQD